MQSNSLAACGLLHSVRFILFYDQTLDPGSENPKYGEILLFQFAFPGSSGGNYHSDN